jgi:hypothetical protein
VKPITKTLFNLIACSALSICLVLVLQVLSKGSNEKNNHFVRLFPPHIVNGYLEKSLNNRNFYFAGIRDSDIVLGNYVNPQNALIVSRDLSGLSSYNINIPKNEMTIASDYNLSVENNSLLLSQYSKGLVYRCNISDSFKNVIFLDSLQVSTSICLPISDRSYVICSYDRNFKKNVLGKMMTNPRLVTQHPEILESQLDGIFSTDGMLRYDKYTFNFIYVYLYRNQFIVMDSMLNIRYRSQTIDTNTYAKIKVIDMPAQGKSTIASPGFYVNRDVCIDPQWIFINSGIKADNEKATEFKANAVIDVYSLKNGRYYFSFYVPATQDKISSMLIRGSILYAVQGGTIFAYVLDLSGIKI